MVPTATTLGTQFQAGASQAAPSQGAPPVVPPSLTTNNLGPSVSISNAIVLIPAEQI